MLACGSCGTRCPEGGTCTNGICSCPTNQVNCNGDFCADLSSDPNHCGTCDTNCGDGVCVSGVCHCPDGLTECNNNCVDTTTNERNCGACQHRCDQDFGVCTDSVCACTDGLLACNNGRTCVDQYVDVNNCGACGVQCTDQQWCDNGTCACRPGLTEVSGNCVDLLSDPQNCGTTGTTCAEVCLAGECAAACGGGNGTIRECDGACVNTRTDPNNCGECGRSCNADEVCVDGECRNWDVAVGCNTCPCNNACTGNNRDCCPYPGADVAICIEGGCP
jgi:hypothetical protein